MAAVIEFDYFGANAVEPAGVSAEGGWKFNREDTQSGTAPVPIPTVLGQNFSWYKQFGFKVTTIGGTVSNFTIKLNGAIASAGVRMWMKSLAAYAQATNANRPADDGSSNSATPAGYSAVGTSVTQWYAGPVSAGSTGRKGDFLVLVLGVGFDYLGGGNSNLTLPAMTAYYDEA